MMILIHMGMDNQQMLRLMHSKIGNDQWQRGTARRAYQVTLATGAADKPMTR